jgi:hypothetical protein
MFRNISTRTIVVSLTLGIATIAGTAVLVPVVAANANGSGTLTVRPQGAPPLPPPPPWWGSDKNVAGTSASHPATLPIAGPDGQLLRNPDGSLKMVASSDTPPILGGAAENAH